MSDWCGGEVCAAVFFLCFFVCFFSQCSALDCGEADCKKETDGNTDV